MDAAAAPTLFTGPALYTTIQADGYARWYQVGDAAGKTMTAGGRDRLLGMTETAR